MALDADVKLKLKTNPHVAQSEPILMGTKLFG